MEREGRADHVRLEVWGPWALFSRPEFSNERYSYDCITPSAARNVLQQVYWHPNFQYQVTSIDVYNRIRHIPVTRNELDSMPSGAALVKTLQCLGETGRAKDPGVQAHTTRQQRTSCFLQDVYYGIEADILPSKNYDGDFDIRKIRGIFDRRVSKGASFGNIYLGCKECIASFAEHRYHETPNSYYAGEHRPLGIMLFDMDYTNPDAPEPKWFNAVMIDGRISVPTQKEVLGDAAYCTV